MAEVRREGQRVRVVLVDGDSAGAAPIVSEVTRALREDGVGEVIIDIPGDDLPDRAVVSELIQTLTSETLARGVPLRFKL